MNALSIHPGELTREQVLHAVNTTFDGVLDAHAKGDELPELAHTFTLARAARDRRDFVEHDRLLGELLTAAVLTRAQLRADHPEICS